jgi:hypothetical protein
MFHLPYTNEPSANNFLLPNVPSSTDFFPAPNTAHAQPATVNPRDLHLSPQLSSYTLRQYNTVIPPLISEDVDVPDASGYSFYHGDTPEDH